MMTCWWKEKMASWRWKILVTLIDQERSIWWQQNIRLDTCKANKKKSRPLKIVGYLMESALVHVVKFLCHTTHKPDRSVTTSPSTVLVSQKSLLKFLVTEVQSLDDRQDTCVRPCRRPGLHWWRHQAPRATTSNTTALQHFCHLQHYCTPTALKVWSIWC